MTDIVEKWRSSLLQHGEYNNRVYLMKLADADGKEIISYLNQLAKSHGYTKIFAKIPERLKYEFDADGYIQEAFIPQFYQLQESACFMAKFLDEKRKTDPNLERIKNVLETAKAKAATIDRVKLAPPFSFQIATEEDIPQRVTVFRKVFATYPFPIHDPDYIKKTMNRNVRYFLICKDEQVVAVSSAEIDFQGKNVEMTDFATLPEYRGMGFALYLLYQMETVMKKTDIRCFHTIARAMSYGMNITFAKRGYKYSGTLVNNTNISGQLESMNVWYKIA